MSEDASATMVESVTVEIAAPQEHVWSVLVDVARYPEWNPFTVRVDTTLEVGSPIDLHLPEPTGSGQTFVTREWLTVVDAPRHLQYDTRDELEGIHAVRDQWVEALGQHRCSYRTTDAFSGEHAALVFDLQGAWMKEGFDALAHALKERSEQLWDGRG